MPENLDAVEITEFSEAVLTQMKWQSSPLKRAIEQTIEAEKVRQRSGRPIGANKATADVIGGAMEMVEVYSEILSGKRDSMGYPV